jgi:hypothetical protein
VYEAAIVRALLRAGAIVLVWFAYTHGAHPLVATLAKPTIMNVVALTIAVNVVTVAESERPANGWGAGGIRGYFERSLYDQFVQTIGFLIIGAVGYGLLLLLFR